ncbi:N-acetylmuramate alpha-1-phosphate uridylyltransferase MurU [Neisseria sp. Ec49-e6-T10]|uniref:N-acetylmuramate alpha-1-phosphate uridylyltransferase MurU n=1 Tax=Neisseria sp. Ec49-e6-T10 TaxID=3140744 RepID=UPI003EB69824
MKAMILAAGRGERMRPLTDHTPKPLLMVGKDPLIVWHIKHLAKAGFIDIVINHAWLGQQLEETLGNGAKWHVHLHYSAEKEGGLETAGGIATALPLLGTEHFLVVNGDIFTSIDFLSLREHTQYLAENQTHIILVPNPEHHPQGDFVLDANNKVQDIPESQNKYTFSGVGIYHPSFFKHTPAHQKAKLAPLLKEAMHQQQVLGQLHTGLWLDVGTTERLALANDLAKTESFL